MAEINNSFFKQNNTIIVGLSGGPDSVCLLHWIVQLRNKYSLTIIAAHLDHEWRKDSKKDVDFCRSLCKKLNVPFKTKKISELTNPIKKTGSQEDAARQHRKNFFKMIMDQNKADFIALGHHADDQIETFFIRLIRGTTTEGLQCMKVKNENIIRPLLHWNKQDISDYLKMHKLSYLTDPTNVSDAHLRNKIRNTLLPSLDACDARGRKNILRAIEQIQMSQTIVEKEKEQAFHTCVKDTTLNCKLLKTYTIFLQRSIVQKWLCKNDANFALTERFLDEVLRFLCSERGGTHQLGTTWCLSKSKNQVRIKKIPFHFRISEINNQF